MCVSVPLLFSPCWSGVESFTATLGFTAQSLDTEPILFPIVLCVCVRALIVVIQL